MRRCETNDDINKSWQKILFKRTEKEEDSRLQFRLEASPEGVILIYTVPLKTVMKIHYACKSSSLFFFVIANNNDTIFFLFHSFYFFSHLSVEALFAFKIFHWLLYLLLSFSHFQFYSTIRNFRVKEGNTKQITNLFFICPMVLEFIRK